jgi:hypothetical protein
MRIYSLTKLGRKVADNNEGESEEMKVLIFLRNNKTSTDTELEVIGGGNYTMRKLVDKGLVRELTD